jgi:hypothetical protein
MSADNIAIDGDNNEDLSELEKKKAMLEMQRLKRINSPHYVKNQKTSLNDKLICSTKLRNRRSKLEDYRR